MKTIRMFIASSKELSEERLHISDLILQLQKFFEDIDVKIVPVKWEFLVYLLSWVCCCC